MDTEPRSRVLIASNRGPVSFRRAEDGTLTSHRGGGGVVSGLSSVAESAEVLWVCAALSDADRAAARAAPGGYLDISINGGGGAAPGDSHPGGHAPGDSQPGGAAPGGDGAQGDGQPGGAAPGGDGGLGDGQPGGRTEGNGRAEGDSRAEAGGWTEGDGQASGRTRRVPRSGVRMLDIPAPVFDRAYNAVANSVLWFIHHMLYDTPNRPNFGLAFRREWDSFRAYSAAFADALAEGAGPPGGARVRAMVQDYHLSLVPRLLADRRPDLAIAHFSHTPWAPPEYYALLPDDVAAELLGGILGADHAGFHARRWASAFLDCCQMVLGARVDRQAATVTYRGHTTTVGVHGLGVDAAELRERASAADVEAHVAALTSTAGGRKLIVRIDRTELSKNIVRGLAAYRELLITHPEWRGKVTHLAFAYPSRHDLPEYREYTARVQRVAREIVDEFGTEDWDPVVLKVNDDYPRSLAAYRLADVLLVNPIRDGMNLVAKEGPLLSERGCALVLSREAGAAAELADGALLVNPYDVAGTAEALHEALSMSDSERLRRGALLSKASSAAPPAHWFGSQISALTRACQPAEPPARPNPVSKWLQSHRPRKPAGN